MKCQSFVVKVKKNEFDKVSTKIDGAVEFVGNNLHLTIRNYLVNSFFIIFSKDVANGNMLYIVS